MHNLFIYGVIMPPPLFFVHSPSITNIFACNSSFINHECEFFKTWHACLSSYEDMHIVVTV